MNKQEFIAAVAQKTEMTKVDAEKAIEAFKSVVTEELTNGNTVKLVGFGTYEVSERAEREGRNPKTGEPMTIKATRVPKFRAGKAFKDIVKGGM